ncbi:hypothetical protein GCM10009430_11270 [Aquimarina litoralis]|uniref:Uncharacterized protein n=1 Tax=Aquimarina litoralis TaxID=584605 RepID=A0ABN1IL44_9FLAO
MFDLIIKNAAIKNEMVRMPTTIFSNSELSTKNETILMNRLIINTAKPAQTMRPKILIAYSMDA